AGAQGIKTVIPRLRRTGRTGRDGRGIGPEPSVRRPLPRRRARGGLSRCVRSWPGRRAVGLDRGRGLTEEPTTRREAEPREDLAEELPECYAMESQARLAVDQF